MLFCSFGCLFDGQSQHISDANAICNLQYIRVWCGVVWCNGLFYFNEKWNSVRLNWNRRIVETRLPNVAPHKTYSPRPTPRTWIKRAARTMQNGINECECHFQHISQRRIKYFINMNRLTRVCEESCMQCTHAHAHAVQEQTEWIGKMM